MRRSIIWTACIVLISFLMFVEDVLGASASPWVLVSNMITARDQFAGCVIGDKIYVFGGNGNPGGINLNSGEVYDIGSFSWSSIAANSHNAGDGVEEVTGAAVNDKFYVFGGWDKTKPGGYYGVFNFNEVYDPAANTWTTLAQKPTTTAAAVPVVYDGKIYLFGGYYVDEGPGGDQVYYSTVEAYDPASNAWQSEANMPKTLVRPAVAVYNDSAYVIGGFDINANKMNTEVMVYNFVSNTWAQNYCTAPANAARIYSYATQTPVVNGKAYLVGGSEGTIASNWATNKFTIFDINSCQWQIGAVLPEPRIGHLAVVYNNDVYVIGGYAVYGNLNRDKSTVYCLSANKKTSAVFNSGGTPVTLSVTGGGWYEIAGDNNDFDQITLHDTTAKSIFTIKTAAGQYTSVGDIIVHGSLNGIFAKTTDLRGNITIDGTIGKIELRNIDSDHKITIGHPSPSNPKAGVLLNFGQVNDLSIDSNTPIKVLMCTRWLDNDANKDYIKAPSLGTLQVKGDSKNNIAGDFECDLRLDGNSVTGATLTNVKIAGDVNNHNWNIIGGVRTLQVGGWIDSNMVIDGNVASLKLNQLHGNLDIEGNAANISIGEPMALSAPESGEIGRLTVSGKATIKAGKDTIKFTNGSSLLHNSGTLYTSEPNMYRLEDLRMYNSLGADWGYYSSYKITGPSGSDSGTVDGTVSVQSALQDGSYIVDSSITDNYGDEVTVSTGWHTAVSGGTHLTSFEVSDSLDDFGDLQLTGDVSLIDVEFLRLGQHYKYSGSLSGYWYNLPTDLYGTIDVAIDSATIATTCKLIGHEQVSVGTGTDKYLAAKIAISIVVKGTGHFTYNSIPYNGVLTANQTQTIWCVPEVGIVKAASSMSVGGHGGGGGVSYKIIETDLLN